MQLKDLFQVKSRFYRSVQIELDESLDDYILTQTGLKILRRIGEALNHSFSARAWTITGPYGSGKSAFIVYLKLLFGDRKNVSVVKARSLLKTTDINSYKKLFQTNKFLKSKKGFCHALVSAGRERIEVAILKGLQSGLKDFYGSKKTNLLSQVDSLIAKSERGQYPSTDSVVRLCEEVTSAIVKSNGSGLLLVIDELGKCLEAAAMNPESDIFVLQKLAESASRSQKTPFLLFTVLHQSFDRYANRLDSEKRNEWSKVQGRFEDVSFVDSSDQVFKLISAAIVHRRSSLKTDKVFSPLAHVLKGDHHRSSKAFLDLLKHCLPLHPLTTMILVPLFRSKLSQNERGLFAFLTSTEPGGFSDFLARTKAEDELPLYTLTHLHDYLTASYGTALFTQANGKKWVEIDNALSRSIDDLERKVIKVVGVLNLFSESLGFPINEETVVCALAGTQNSKAVQEALNNLCKKSVIIYRKYSHSYVLWGGSDIDIEKKVQETKNSRASAINIAEALNRLFPLRPRIAKRHLYEKGTLRYFKAYYADFENLGTELQKPIEDGDGQLIFILNTSSAVVKAKDVQKKLLEAPQEVSNRTLIGVANDAERFVSMFSELLSLQHVRKNTPELQGDPIALREIEARLIQIERTVDESIDELFFNGGSVNWLDAVAIEGNISKKEMSKWISDICDRVYSLTPVLKNELINRNRMSSTSMSARRVLLNAMLEGANKRNLGIEGYPPEFSMYQSVLKSSGIHTESSDGWKFTADPHDLKPSWRPLWRTIDRHLTDNESRRVPVTELFSLIQKPPLGLKEGVLPVIFTAILKAYDSEIALFETGTFRPIIKTADVELITKVPEKYSVQLCRIVGVKAIVFEQIIQTFMQKQAAESPKKINLLQIVKMLCSFASALPVFVQKTANLTPKAKAVRQCLLDAVEPASLLYRDLPIACGLKPITHKGGHNEAEAKLFVAELRGALSEIQRKESELYHRIETILFHAFNLEPDREALTERAKNIISVTMDPVVKGFLVRVTDSLEQKAWLDSIGTVIVARPPLSWSDDDLLSFEHQMSALSAKIIRYERLALEVGTDSKNLHEVRQVSIMSNKAAEISKIIHIDFKTLGNAKKIEGAIARIFEEFSDKGEEAVWAALSNYLLKKIEQKPDVVRS